MKNIAINYHDKRADSLSNEIRKLIMNEDFRKLIAIPYTIPNPNNPKENTIINMYEYAGMLSPISLDEENKLDFSAHQGSRYLGREGHPAEYYYRLHEGTDFSTLDGSLYIKGESARATISGTVKYEGGILTITSDDGNLQIAYHHMDSASVQIHDGKVSVGMKVGEVSDYLTAEGRYHLHYEIKEKQEFVNEKGEKVSVYIAIDPTIMSLEYLQKKAK